MRSARLQVKINRAEINYLRITVESYDGMALVRTIDPSEGLVELFIAPGCEDQVLELLEALKKEGLALWPCLETKKNG